MDSSPRGPHLHSHPHEQRIIRPKLSGSDAQKRRIVAREGRRANSTSSIEPSLCKGNRSKNARPAELLANSRVPTNSKRMEFQLMNAVLVKPTAKKNTQCYATHRQVQTMAQARQTRLLAWGWRYL